MAVCPSIFQAACTNSRPPVGMPERFRPAGAGASGAIRRTALPSHSAAGPRVQVSPLGPKRDSDHDTIRVPFLPILSLACYNYLDNSEFGEINMFKIKEFEKDDIERVIILCIGVWYNN